MPEDLSVGRIERDEVLAVAGEQQLAGGREMVDNAAAAGPVVFPHNFARMVIERFESVAFVAHSAIQAAPAFRMIVGVDEIEHAPRPAGSHVKEPSLWAETRRLPIGGA